MKVTKRSRRGIIFVAVAGAFLLATAVGVRAQTLTPQLDELILGFYATNGVGETLDLEVDLGNMNQFYNATPGSTIPLPGLSVQDLSNIYGSSWYTRTDLFWGAVSTTGRAQGTSDGHAPVGTLWATRASGLPVWNRGSVFAQKTASPNIEALIDDGSPGSLYGASNTVNSTQAAVINATESGSWKVQDQIVAGESFGYFNPSVDNNTTIPSGGQVVSALYELQPTNVSGIAATFLGNLVLTQTGLSFQAAVGPAASFDILSIARSGNDIDLTWVAPGGTTNWVQATNGSNGSYATNGFADISSPIINSGMASTAVTNNYSDHSGATNRPSRFYRISQEP
jgi:hypothetical protein